jgi:ABC-type antimicrobial peptide transport system permease subunit
MKQYNMQTTDKSNNNGIKAFESEPSGMYSKYDFTTDKIPVSEGFDNAITQNLSGITELLNQHNKLKKKLKEGFSDIPARFSNMLPPAPDTSVEEGRIADLQEIMFQQNMMYSIGSIAAVSFLVGAIVLARN